MYTYTAIINTLYSVHFVLINASACCPSAQQLSGQANTATRTAKPTPIRITCETGVSRHDEGPIEDPF